MDLIEEQIKRRGENDPQDKLYFQTVYQLYIKLKESFGSASITLNIFYNPIKPILNFQMAYFQWHIFKSI